MLLLSFKQVQIIIVHSSCGLAAKVQQTFAEYVVNVILASFITVSTIVG